MPPKRIIIDQVGLGLNTEWNPTHLKLGESRVSKNLMHNRGSNRAQLRNGIDRDYFTRTANAAVFGLFEYINNAGTTTLLCQTNGVLESFTHGLTGAKTTVDSGHQSTNISRFTQALNFWLEADARDNNYIGNGTTGYPLQIAAPGSTHTVIDNGGGNLSGAYNYDYARYSSVTGEIGPAYGTATSITVTGRQTQVAVTIATSEQFDQIRFYRTRAGGTQYYELTTITISGGAATYNDNTADSGLTTVSTIHTSAGASNTDRPVAATDVVAHRGRIHLIGLTGNRSRYRWSQLNAFQFDSTTDARHDLSPDDGDFLWRGFSVDGAMVLMKDHSIWIQNGDVDELSFTWQVASDKDAGIGSYCPFTAVNTPIGVIFQAECGVYLFRPGMPRPELISGNIQTTLEGLDYSRRLFFVGEYDPCNNIYILSVTPSAQTTNTQSYVFTLDTGKWAGPWEFGGSRIRPSIMAKMHNSSSRIKVYLGDTNGYVYETDTSTGSDGVSSGTETGTVTSGTATTLTDTAATFRTSGNGLLGVPATIQTATGTYETQEISSNTGTVLTTATWTTTPSTQTYWVGAIDGILSLGRIDAGTAGYKRFIRLTFEFQSQSAFTNLLLGFTVDGDTEPTTVSSVSQNGVFRRSILINRIAIGLSPYVRVLGTDTGFEILKIELDYHDLAARPGT